MGGLEQDQSLSLDILTDNVNGNCFSHSVLADISACHGSEDQGRRGTSAGKYDLGWGLTGSIC
jgi:hypothetical protein